MIDICGVKQLTKLRLEFSALNEHRFRHNFQRISPMCACNTGIEDNAYFFLQCPLFDTIRNDPVLNLIKIRGNLYISIALMFQECGTLSKDLM